MAATFALGAGFSGPARGGSPQCEQCCSDNGLYSCPTRMRVYGEGSELRPEGGGYRITGVWNLDCETGASFDSDETVVLPHEPRNGQVLLVGYSPVTVRCFRDWCMLPANACVEERPDGDVLLQRCTDGQPMRASELVRAGTPPPSVYVPPQAMTTPAPPATRSPLPNAGTPPRPTAAVVAPLTPQPNPGTVPAPRTPQPNPGTLPAPLPAPTSVVMPTPSPVLPSPPEPAVLEAPPPEYPPHLPAEGPLHISLAFDIPEPPGERCFTTAVVAAEARRRLDLGDEARLRGDNQTAIDEYRAAVTLDRCSAIAWAALGQLALAADDTEKAIFSLEIATRLRADHYGALTSLGLAYEARGRFRMAEDAFTRALQVRPGHPAAVEGLARVRARP